MKQTSIREKIKYVLRPDKALSFVWEAGPGIFLLSLLLIIVQGLIPLAALYLMKIIVDKVAWAMTADDSVQAFRVVLIPILLAGALALLTAIVQQVSKFIKELQATTVTDHVYDVIHEKSLSVDLEYYENPDYFDSLHRAQREGPYRPTRIVAGLTIILQSAVSLIALAGLLISFHWGLSLVLFAAAIPGLIVRLLNAGKMNTWQRKRTRTERKAHYYNVMMTCQDHAKEVRLFNLGKLFSDRFSDLRTLIRTEKIQIMGRRTWGDVLAQFCAVIAVFSALSLIAYRCVTGNISLGEFVMYFQAFQRSLGYMKEFFEGLASLYEDTLFIHQFYEFLDIEPRVREAEHPLPLDTSFEKGLIFDHISFTYNGSKRTALKDISFQVKPGEVIALVGENGSGKTTLVKLLCRLYDPDQGQILLDGNDLKSYKIKDVRRQISVIFQDYIKYQMTVRENIWMGDAAQPCDDESIKKAAIYANAHGLIESLPKAYDTMLGQWMGEGEELSLGQWQKIALARAFYGKARIVVLDEPTSSLDPESEYQVFLTFRQLLENRTAFLISHRFSTVKMADRILVLSDGRITESGTHAQLMAMTGTYSRMYSQQAGNYI
ncbi:MAG: ABC transporter ATP-binding protein/permease [Proteobacteria bacterium]|nr:ABC transporter ATP-binding protein/permease [Pseudomonadota bacterium]